jgi:hypothetical protein
VITLRRNACLKGVRLTAPTLTKKLDSRMRSARIRPLVSLPPASCCRNRRQSDTQFPRTVMPHFSCDNSHSRYGSSLFWKRSEDGNICATHGRNPCDDGSGDPTGGGAAAAVPGYVRAAKPAEILVATRGRSQILLRSVPDTTWRASPAIAQAPLTVHTDRTQRVNWKG